MPGCQGVRMVQQQLQLRAHCRPSTTSIVVSRPMRRQPSACWISTEPISPAMPVFKEHRERSTVRAEERIHSSTVNFTRCTRGGPSVTPITTPCRSTCERDSHRDYSLTSITRFRSQLTWNRTLSAWTHGAVLVETSLIHGSPILGAPFPILIRPTSLI